MAEQKVTGRRGSLRGVVEGIGDSDLSREFISPGRTFEDALSRGVIRDDAQKNAVIIYLAQLEMFGLTSEIEHLRHWLNASPAVGGHNRVLASSTKIGVMFPSALGVRLSKEDERVRQEELKEREADRNSRRRANPNNGENPDA